MRALRTTGYSFRREPMGGRCHHLAAEAHCFLILHTRSSSWRRSWSQQKYQVYTWMWCAEYVMSSLPSLFWWDDIKNSVNNVLFWNWSWLKHTVLIISGKCVVQWLYIFIAFTNKSVEKVYCHKAGEFIANGSKSALYICIVRGPGCSSTGLGDSERNISHIPATQTVICWPPLWVPCTIPHISPFPGHRWVLVPWQAGNTGPISLQHTWHIFMAHCLAVSSPFACLFFYFLYVSKQKRCDSYLFIVFNLGRIASAVLGTVVTIVVVSGKAVLEICFILLMHEYFTSLVLASES